MGSTRQFADEMKRGSIECVRCGKEVFRAVAKKRSGRCYECWMSHQRSSLERKHPHYNLETGDDVLSAAFASAPWILKVLRISLPALFVRREIREQYRAYKSRLEPGEQLLPFRFNEWSLAMRKGFLVVKDGQPDRVWITEMS